jgi:hypothetical protein
MRFPRRISSGYWYLCAAGILAVCVFLGNATTLRVTKSGTGAGVVPSPKAAVSDSHAAVGTPLVQIASGKAELKPVLKLSSATPAAKTDPATRVRLTKAYGKLPLSFEANQGQTDPRVKFFSRGHGYSLFLTADEAVLALHNPAALSAQLSGNRRLKFETRQSPIADHQPLVSTALRMQLAGANPSAKVAGVDELPGKSNYFHGNDPQKWRANVSNYGKVRYEQVYPGIDLLYYGNQRQLEYDFVVAPGADPGAIKLAIQGAEKLGIDDKGNLVVRLSTGEVLLHKPVAYQRTTDNGPGTLVNRQSSIDNRQFIDGRYVLLADNHIAFEVSAYDRSKPLIIDPVLSYSTFLGGSNEDELFRIAVDSSGYAYVVGATGSSDFPLQSAYQSVNYGAPDVFVTKLNPTGTALTYSTYLGGDYWDMGYGVAVDASGSAYLTGYTESYNFPVTNGAYQTSLPGSYASAFVTKLNSSGSLVYSTFLGGTTHDVGYAIAVDSSGQAYVTGPAYSSDFPTTTSAYDRTCGTDTLCDGWNDAFVTKLNATGTAPLMYSTYLGGNDEDDAYDLVLDSSGNVYVTGVTWSTNFPTKSAYDSTCGTDGSCNTGYSDAFVAKISPSQTGAASLVYSTYLGGSGTDGGFGLAVDTSGSAYITGYTYSTDSMSTPGAYQTTLAAYRDCFITKLNSSGSARVYSTYLGGADYDRGMAIAVNSSGNAYVLGETYSTDLPATPDAIQAANAGSLDLFVTVLNAAGSALDYFTYFGGSGTDAAANIVLTPSGSVYVAGFTFSPDFPTTAGVWDTGCGTDVSGNCNYDGSSYYADGFVVKAAPAPLASVAPSSLIFTSTVVGATSASQAVTVSNDGDGVLTISSITLTGTNAGDFGKSTCSSVAPGSSCNINVTFTPTAAGTRTATLTIYHDAPGGSNSVSLSGTATDFTVAAASGSSTDQTVAAGTTATYNITVTPNGFSGSASLSCAWVGTQPNATSCAVLPTSVTLSGTTPQNAAVSVTTTKRSMVGPSLRLPPPGVGNRLMVPWFLWLVGLGMLAMLAAGSRGNQRVWLRRATPFGALLFLILLWSACGGGGGGGGGTTPPPTGTPVGTYSLTVTATAGGGTRNITLTLHVT